MADIKTRPDANVRLVIDLDDDEVFDHTERWGSKRTFRIRRLSASGDPTTGLLSQSVNVHGANVKKDGTEGQQRATYASTSLADLSPSLRAQIEEEFAQACWVLSLDVTRGASVARDRAKEVVA